MKNQLVAIPAFNDNYIWMLHNENQAVVVDPGDAQPVLEVLAAKNLSLEAIFITHHHHDHVGGIEELKRHYPKAIVNGPALEIIPKQDVPCEEGDTIELPSLQLRFEVLDIPGHTAGHIAYFGYNGEQPILFCGDALFSGGCGRLFEGTPAQMLESLNKLAALPEATLVCCAHEYTLSNLNWALEVEPDNAALQHYHQTVVALRQKNQPTLPSTIALEKQINPFLRTQDVAEFARLREWKNNA